MWEFEARSTTACRRPRRRSLVSALPIRSSKAITCCVSQLGRAITVKNWSFNVGIRGDIYNVLSKATQAEPRLGVAYNIKQSNTVLRISYARTLESPFNENLVLSSRGCLDPVVANLFAAA